MWIGDGDVFGEEVGADGGLVLTCEFLGVISIHQRGFANSIVLIKNVRFDCVCCRVLSRFACVVSGMQWMVNWSWIMDHQSAIKNNFNDHNM